MMPGMDTEQELAWRMFHELQTLSNLLWDRYETEFMERHLSEEERREAMKADTEEYPF